MPPPTPVAPGPDGSLVASAGVHLIKSDLQFILDQIIIAERHAAGEDILSLLPNSRVPFGLRTVDGTYNNLVNGQTEFGAADTVFPRLTDPFFRNAESAPPGFGPPTPTSYQQTSGNVFELAAAHDQQPDRRPDRQQSGGLREAPTMPARMAFSTPPTMS